MLLSILLTLLIITTVVTIHEFGHYLACRLFGVRVNEFSIGFGPRLTGFQTENTKWSLRLIPIGGYVSYEDTEMDRASPLAKGLIAFAGPFANLLPFLLVSAWFGFFFRMIVGLANIYSLTMMTVLNYLVYPLRWIVSLFIHIAPIHYEGGLSGPIGVAQIATQSTHDTGAGNTSLMLFLVMSIGLAMINLMPLPPFDGGQMVLAGIEAIFGKKIARRMGVVLRLVGFGVILILFLEVTASDILHLA